MERSAPKRALALLAGRVVAYQAVFLVLHFAYGWWPNGLTAIVSGVDESVFQHMKVGFFSWLALSAGEWAVFKPLPFADFAASRLVGAAAMPCAFAAAWYVAAATIGPLPSDLAEIAWANLVMIACSLFVLGLQDHLGARPLPAPLRAAIFASAAAMLFMYIRFTFSPPWVDLFEVPKVMR